MRDRNIRPTEREEWGTKNYNKDMDFSLCRQSESTDEYGTVEGIYNAIRYYDVFLYNQFQNSIELLKAIQKGMSDKEFEMSGADKKLDDHHGMRKSGDPQAIANLVHHYLDWLRATNKRTWDSRGLNPSRGMLDACVKGLYLNWCTCLHYDESAER